MTLQQLKYVVEIAKYKSINRASASLFTSQSSVSASLTQLENEIGIRLFKRHTNGVTLTDAGSKFILYATSVLERMSCLEDVLKMEKSKILSHKLSISSQHHQCSCAAFSKIIKKDSYSDYEFSFNEKGLDAIIDDVENRKADIGIVVISESCKQFVFKHLTKKNIKFHLLTKIKGCIFCSKTHPLAKKSSVSLKEIEEYPYATFGINEGIPVDFIEGVKELALNNHRKYITTDSRSVMTNFIVETNAISTGTGLVVENFTDSNMISIPIADFNDVFLFGWICNEDVNLNDITKEYVSVLENVTAESLEYTNSIWEKKWLK